jgi:uncharacterized protein
MQFEWDEEKRAANIRKHKVDFLTATLIFENETVERIDDREDYGEERVIALGRVEGAVYRVVYTLRGEIVRIISAMKASKDEEEIYYREIFP